MVNAQVWLESQEQCNTKEKRGKITELNFLRNKNLEGKLDLSDFINIRKLDCYDNKLTSLNIGNCSYLTWSSCGNNSLTSIILPNNPTSLKELSLNNNNFPIQDLSFLTPYTNLEYLWLGNNNFTGSLHYLSNMEKLRKLDIRNTNLNSGLEYLSDSIMEFCCSTEERPDAEVKIIEKDWRYFNRNLKKYKEFNNSLVHEWLNKNYPERGGCKRETGDWGWDNILGWNNEGKERKDIIKLDISNQELKGGLRLKGFTGLKSFNCSNNQLTDLDLTDCKELIELKCGRNNLENLNFLTPLISLKELDISDCSNLKGSLKSLENMKELEKVSINHTNISEGLENLPNSCKELYCDLDYEYNSTEIVKQLGKFSEKNQDDKVYYNLDKWREDKTNNPIKLLEEENSKIKSLEDEVQRLVNLIRDKKDRVVRAYLYSFAENEQELLHQLITANLEYSKAKKRNLPSVSLRKFKEKLCNELEERVGEEQMEKIEKVLTDCEDLIGWDIELDEKVVKRNEVIKESGKTVQKVINNFNIDISGVIKVENGQLMIGNSFGNNTDLSYVNKFLAIEDKQVIRKEIVDELKRELLLEYKVEQLPK